MSEFGPDMTPGVKFPSVLSSGDAWDIKQHIVATSRFPGCSIIRKHNNHNGRGTCSCKDGQIHRDLFDFNRQIVTPSLRDDGNIPKVLVCWNAENLFESKLDKKLTGYKNRVFFKDLKTIYDVNKVLFEGTYWYPRLMKPGTKKGKHSLNGLMLLRLLAGLGKPTGKEHISELCAMKIARGAINKLRSILATVDGVIMSLILSFPNREEYQSWEKIDQITNCLICYLMGDYFHHNDKNVVRVSNFEKLKQLRNAIKERGFNPIGDLTDIKVPRELSFYQKCLVFISDNKRPIDIHRVSILCQNRASGVPPRSMYFKTLLKIRTLLQEPHNPSVYEGCREFIAPSVSSIHRKVLDRLGSESKIEKFWQHCLDKAKISLSDSGEFFTKSEDGGKLEAARKILSTEKSIDRINLMTGEKCGVLKPGVDPVGECLFHWACNQFHDRETVYERNVMCVRISLVAELGKYRAITVSHLAHAMLLHVLSHVLLEYLKAIPSSESGVGAANHAWNFFKRLSHKNPNANFIFGDKDVYLFSTDWETATDYCDHAVSLAIINCLCRVLGVPEWYRQTVAFALCAPRQVEFIDEKSKVLEAFYTERGELMGDPVVKVILHYHHLVARESALMQIDIFRREDKKPSKEGRRPVQPATSG